MAGKKKKPSNILQIKVTNSTFLKYVRDAVQKDNVGYDRHARKRMKERGITITQVLRVLETGQIVENVHEDIRGKWKAKLQGGRAEVIEVVVRLDNLTGGSPAIVVSTFIVQR